MGRLIDNTRPDGEGGLRRDGGAEGVGAGAVGQEGPDAGEAAGAAEEVALDGAADADPGGARADDPELLLVRPPFARVQSNLLSPAELRRIDLKPSPLPDLPLDLPGDPEGGDEERPVDERAEPPPRGGGLRLLLPLHGPHWRLTRRRPAPE